MSIAFASALMNSAVLTHLSVFKPLRSVRPDTLQPQHLNGTSAGNIVHIGVVTSLWAWPVVDYLQRSHTSPTLSMSGRLRRVRHMHGRCLPYPDDPPPAEGPTYHI